MSPTPYKNLSNSPADGFTLVELLVSIGIIALLIGILLPVMAKVHEHSNRVACAANLHSIGQALFEYAGDYQDSLPQANDPYVWYSWNGYNTIMPIFFQGYVHDPRVFHCPSSRFPIPDTIDNAVEPDAISTPANSARISYEFYFLWFPPEVGPRLINFKGRAPLSWDLDGADPNSTICNHGLMAGGNVLYSDSHVDWQEASQWDGLSWPSPAAEFYAQ